MRKLTLLISMLFLSLGMAWAQPAASPAPANGKWALGTTWYQIKTGHGNYLRSDVVTAEGDLLLTNSTSTTDDVALWCFVGDAQSGYTFYNRATGPNKPLAMYGEEDGAYARLAESPTGTTAFDFTQSKKSGGTWWCLKEHGSDNNYWNKRSNKLAYWNSTQAVIGWGNSGTGDDGSALLFIDMTTSISNVEEFVNGKVYTVSTTNRGGWTVNEGLTNFISTNDAKFGTTTSKTEARNHFAVLKSAKDKYYLYSLAAKKFVKADCSLAENIGEPINFATTDVANRFLVNFTGYSDKYINLGGDKQMVVNSWSTKDEGNRVMFLGVGEFDYEAVLRTLNVYELLPALDAAITNAESKAGWVGTEVGKYSYDGDYSAKLNDIKTFRAAINQNTTVAEVEAKIKALNTMVSSLSFNAPATGKYYRLKNAESNRYMSANSEGNGVVVIDNGAEAASTIFYLDEDYALYSYTRDLYLDCKGKSLSSTKYSGEFAVAYNNNPTANVITYKNNGAWTFGNRGNGVSIDKGDNNPNLAGYNWYIEEVTELPVATLAELQAALAAENELPIIITETIVIPEGETVVLDLNGKTVTHQDEATKYAINNLGTLTIRDTKGNGSINARGIYNGYENVTTAKITVLSGTINAKGTDGGAAIFNYGVADIKGGNFTSIGGYSLNNRTGASMTIAAGVTANNGIYSNGATLVVDGGEINGNRSGCHVLYAWNSNVTINGGTFHNNNSGNATIFADGTSEVTINGGTISIKDGRVPGNGNTWTSCLTDAKNTAKIIVNGGTLNGGFRVQSGATMTINGGSFNDVAGSGYNVNTGAIVAVKGGTFTDAAAKNFATSNLAAGYELNADGTVAVKPVAEVNGVKYASLAKAVAAAQSGDEIVMLADAHLTATLTLPADIKFNGNGKTITADADADGNLFNMVANGNIEFVGYTKVAAFNAGYNKPTITIGAGACLEMTGARMVIGHGAKFNITGNITEAKTANVADLTPSLVMAGASFTGAGVTFNVTNAYIKAPSSYCSSSKSASGTFDFNITNSIWESAGKLAFEEQSVNAKVDFALVNSVLTTGSHLVFGTASGEEGVVIENSYVNKDTSRQLENCGTMTIKNGSVVNGAVARSSNAKNPGTIIVENATYAVTGEFSGSDLGTGTIIIKNGATVSAGSITKANIKIDATGMAAGDEVLTANLSQFTGELSVINNDKLEAKIVDGKIVLVNLVAKIGETSYDNLLNALKAAQDGETVVMYQDVELYTRLIFSLYTNGKNVTLDGNGHKLFASSTNWGTGNGKHLINVNCDNVTLKDIVLDCNKIAEGANIYKAQNIVFDNVSIINKKGWNADLTVNGSTLAVANKLSASYVDVSLGQDVTTPLGIVANEGAVLDTRTLQIAPAAYPNTNLDKALSTDGTSYYSLKKVDANGNVAGYSNSLSRLSNGYGYVLLEDLTTNSNVTLLDAGHSGTLNTNGHTLTVADGKTLTVNGNLALSGDGTVAGAIALGNAAASVSGAEGLSIKSTVGDSEIVYKDGQYVVAVYVAQIGETKYASIAEALADAKTKNLSEVVITIIGENTAATADKFNLYQASVFNKVTFKQENDNKPYYFEELYTGSRTNNGKFVFDGVNLVVTGKEGQYIFEGNVVLSNNSLIKSTVEANCFVYNAEVTVEAGSKIDGVIEDIRGGSLIIDGGKTDGTYCEEPALRDAILNVNWATSNLVLKNGAYVKVNAANEVGRLTVNGKVDVSNSKLESYQYIAVNQGATFTLNAGSVITTKELTGVGVINVDAEGMTAGDVVNLTADLSKFTGTFTVLNNDKLEAKIVDGKVVLAAKPVAKIGEQGYATLEAAFAAAAEGATITLLDDATPALTSQRAITKAAVIDLGGKTMTLTEDDLYFGTTTFKNGTIVVDPSVKPSTAVFWMFANQTLTFDNVKIVATGVTGTYLIGLEGDNSDLNLLNGSEILVENTTALDLDIICVNGTNTCDINVDNSKVNVTNLDGRVFFRGNYTVKDSEVNLAGITKAGFRIEAGQTLSIEGTSKVNIEGEPRDGGIHMTDLTATYTKAETATVNATVNEPKVAKVGDNTYRTLAQAVAAVEDGGTITLIANETFTKTNRTHNSGNWYDGLYYVGDKSFTIDLGGFTISQDGAVNDYLLNFKNDGAKANTITLKNGTLDAGTAAFCAICTSSSQANDLTINTENINIINDISNGSTIKLRGGAVLNVKDGTKITGKNSYLGIECLASTVNIYDGAEIYMNGTSSYNGCLVGVGGNGVINVYGGYGKGVKGGYIAMTSGGTINISGGEWIANTDGTVGNNSNLYVLTAQNNKYESGYKGASIINVTGGTFRGGMDAWVLNDATVEKAELNISGGNFNANPTSYVAEDYIAVENNGVWNVGLAAAKIGKQGYATLEEAFKAATDGCTIDILSDVTVDYAWDARNTGAKFNVPVTINGKGNTIKFTASVNDNNYQAPFRFEADATVKNLTIDMSEVTDNRFRAISSKGNLTVDGCKFIGKDETLNCRAIIFGEGAGANVGNLAIAITNSEFINWKRGITDNENAQDVKTVTITGNTLTDAGVGVSAKEAVTFTGNTVAGAYVNIKSYTAGNKLAVTATGNTLEANTDAAYNVIDAGGVVNAEGFNVVAKGGKIIGYTSTEGIWGEVWGNARESFVIKVLDANDNVMGTSSLNNVGGIIDGDVTVSWNLKFNAASNTDEYWTMAWTTAPTINNMPAKVQLWVDGVKVSEGDVVLNGPDNLWPIAVAVTDENGVIKSCAKSLKDAIAAGNNVAILKAGTYALEVKDGLTITGAVEGVEFANIGAFGCDGANVTFNNVTFTYANNSTYKGLQHSGNLVYNNCTFNGQVFLYGQSETFNKCTFNTTDSNNYNVWTYGAKNVAFIECTFNSAGKSVLIYAESASVTNNVTVTKSQFIASQAVDGKAAIEMDASMTAGINLTIDADTKATGFAAGNVSGNSLWNNKKGNADDANNDITVVVAGETVLAPVYEAKIGEKNYRNLQDAINAVQNGETVVLTQDFTGNVTLTEKVDLYYTIDGDGKTMNGTIAITPLSDENDNRRITIKNIKFVNTADAKVDFISCVVTNHYPRLTVEGCTFTGNGKDVDVALRLKTAYGAVIKDCTGTGLHSFLQNTAGKDFTIEKVTVTDSKSAFALGTVQGVTVKGVNVDVKGYGIRMDAQYNNNAVLENNTVKAFIPVVVRKAEVNSNVTFNGDKNAYTATNTDGIWCAVGTSEYEADGEMPTAATAEVKVNLTNTGLDAAGVYGSYYDALTIHVGATQNSRMVTRDIYVTTMDEAVAEAKAINTGAVIYKVYGEVELTTGGSHGILDLGKNVVIEGADPTAKLTIVGGGVPDIKGVTFRNITLADEGTYLPTANEFMYQNYIDCTFENVTFVDGIRLSGTSSIKDSKVDANTTNEYAIWLDEGDFTMTGTTVVGGADAYGLVKSDAVSKITITGNTFQYLGEANKEALNVKEAVVIAENNQFIDCVKGILPADKTNYTDESKTTVATDATIIAGNNNTVTVNYAAVGEQKFETLLEAINAVQEGETITLLRNVTMDYNARDAYATQAQNVVINGNGKVLTLNQKNSDWASFGLANNSKLVLNNMTIEKTGYGDTNGAWNTHAIIFSCPVEMTDVTVNNSVAVQAGAALNNVTINEANGYYGLWINGNGQTVTVNGGAITATNGGRGIKIADQYIDAPAQVILSVDGTVFNTAKKAAVLVSSTAGANINAANVNIENVAEDKVNFVWVDEDWAQHFGNVEVTGATVRAESADTFTAAITANGAVQAYYKTLAEAINAAEAGATVELLADVTLAGGYADATEGLRIEKEITLNGNGHTIDCGTFQKGIRVYNPSNAGDFNVNFNNVKVVNNVANGRCIDTRSGNINLKVISSTLIATKGNSQPLTIGGNDPVHRVTLNGTTIDAGASGYAVISFVSTNVDINGANNSTISGYAAFYLKGDAKTTNLNLGQGVYTGTNNHAVESGLFGTIVLEGANNVVNLMGTNATVKAVANNTAPQAAFLVRGANNTIKVTKESAKIITEGNAYEAIVDADNASTTKFIDMGVERKLVAEADGRQFYSFEDAVRFAGNKGTIKVVNDFVLAEAWTIPAGMEYTLDLNGKTVSYTSAVAGEDMITNRGNLTITDSSDAKTGKLAYVNNDATASNVTVSTISTEPGSTLVVDGGTIENKTVKADGSSIYSYAIDILTNGNLGDVNVTINGGTVYSDYMAIRQFNNGTACKNSLTIEGGYIYGAKRAVQVHIDNNAAVTAINRGKVEAGEGGYAICNFAATSNLAVTGGEFIGAVYSARENFISGGIYDAEVYAGYCAEGYMPNKNVDGTYGVVLVANVVATVDGYAFGTLAEAIKAVKAGDNTIELLADCAEKVTIAQVNGTNIVINGNGKTYTGTITVRGDKVANNLYNTETLTFQNINFAPAYNTYAITAERNTYARNITVDGCTFKGNNDVYGIRVRNGYNYTVKNTTVEGVYTFLNASEALTGLTVDNVTVTCANVAFAGAYGFGNASFKEVTIKSANNGVKVNNPNSSALTFENCSITAKTPVTFIESAGVASELTAEFNGTNTMVVNNGGTYWFNIVEADATDATFKAIVNDADLDMSNTAFAASVGNVYYSSLQKAIDAAVDGNTVVVARDIELNAADCVKNSDGYSVFVNVAGKAITIDLNGKAVTANLSEDQFASAKSSLLMAVFSVDTNGNLTLNDSKGTGKVAVTANDASVYSLISNYHKTAKLTINGGSYELDNVRAKSSLIHSDPSEAVVVNGGNFYLGNVNTGVNNSPWIFNVNGNNTGHVIVNGGTFNYDVNHQYWAFEVHVDKDKAVKANGDGTWTVVDAIAYVTEENNGYTREAGYATVEEAINSKYGNVVTILAGDYTMDIAVNKAGVTVQGETDENGNLVNITGRVVASTGTTVKNLNVKNEKKGNYDCALCVNGKDIVIDGVNLSGYNGMRMCYAEGNITIMNSVIEGSSDAVHFDGKAGGVIAFENSTITGYCAYASTIESVTYTNCTLNQGQYFQRFYNKNVAFNECTFNDGFKIELLGSKQNVTFTDADMTMDDVKALMKKESYITSHTVKLNGTQVTYAVSAQNKLYSTLQAAIDDLPVGGTATYWLNLKSDNVLTEGVVVPAGVKATINLNGFDIIGTPAEAKAYAVITNRGTLTIEGKGSVICNHTLAGSTGYAVNTITNCGTLTIEDNAIIENKSTAQYQIGYAIDNNSTSTDATVTVNGGKVIASGSLYYDGIRQFCNSETKENDVYVVGGEVSTIWMQNPSDGATKNTKDVNGYVGISGGTVGVLSLEPSANFQAAITAGHVGEVSYFQTADGRDLKEFVTGGTFGTLIDENFLAWGYQLEGAAAPYKVEWTGCREEVTFIDGEFTEYTNEKEIEVEKLRYVRKFSTAWTPLYAPFEIPVSKLAEYNLEVAYINGVRKSDYDENGVYDEGWSMELIMIHGGKGNADGSRKTLKANYPYFVRYKKPDDVVTNVVTMDITLEGATLYGADEKSYDCTTFIEKYEITGNCSKMTSDEFEDNYYIVGANGWSRIKEGSYLNPFRFYMTVISREDGSPVVSEASMSIVVRGEELPDGTTVIYDVYDENTEDMIFDLQGRRVLETEKGGIYIKGGKKFIAQ